jgi:hypothetical protein
LEIFILLRNGVYKARGDSSCKRYLPHELE